MLTKVVNNGSSLLQMVLKYSVQMEPNHFQVYKRSGGSDLSHAFLTVLKTDWPCIDFSVLDKDNVFSAHYVGSIRFNMSLTFYCLVFLMLGICKCRNR